jgi:hypothetical protein
MSRFNFSKIVPDAPDKPEASTATIDAVADRHNFISREPAQRVKRSRMEGPIEVLSVKGPLEVMNRFKTYANEEGHSSYWQALDTLLRSVGR